MIRTSKGEILNNCDVPVLGNSSATGTTCNELPPVPAGRAEEQNTDPLLL